MATPDLFAPPTEEELQAVRSPAARGDAYRGASSEEDSLFAPPSEDELRTIQADSELSELGEKAKKNDTDFIYDKEVDAIARKHQVDPEWLRDKVSYYAGFREGEDVPLGTYLKETGKLAVGLLDQAFGGLGTGLYKKLGVEDENSRKALDDLDALVYDRKGKAQIGLELATGLIPGAKLVGAASKAATGAGIGKKAQTAYGLASSTTSGALMGYGGSREGEELSGTLIGGGLGLGLPAIAVGTMTAIRAKANKVVSEGVETYLQGEERSLRDGAEKILSERPELERALRESAEDLELRDAAGKGKTFRKYLDENPRAQALLDSVPDEQVIRVSRDENLMKKIFAEKADDVDERAVRAHILRSEIQDNLRGFARHLDAKKSAKADKKGKGYTGKEARAIIDDHSSRLQPEAIRAEYQRYRTTRASIEYMQREGIAALPGANSFGRRLAHFFSDGKYVMRALDRRYGTDLEPVLDRLTHEGYNPYTVTVAAAEDRYKVLVQKTKDAGLEFEEVTKLLEQPERRSILEPRQRAVIESWQDEFEALRKGAQDKGLRIDVKADYAPHMQIRPDRFIRAVKGRADELADQHLSPERSITSITSEEFVALEKNPDFQEFLKAISLGTSRIPNDPASLKKAYKKATELGAIATRQETKASAAFQRKGEIPEFVREFDVRAVYDRYVRNTFRHAYLRDGLSEIRSQLNILRETGDKNAIRYLENLLEDITGVRENTVANGLRQASLRYKAVLDEKAEQAGGDKTVQGKMLLLAADAPEMLGTMVNQVYANFLGLNPKAAVRNLTQPFVMSAPELRGIYGQRLAIQGQIETLAKKRQGIHLENELKEMGLVPAAFTGESKDYLQRSLRDSATYRVGQKALKAWTETALYFYGKSDMWNRQVTLSMSRHLAGDILSGNAVARKALEGFPPGYRARAMKALDRQDGEELTKVVTDHMLSSSQFNYNRISMSEFGRTMGPLFSMFSKWPTSIAGDIMYKTSGGEWSRAATKYAGPLAIGWLADQMLFGPDRDMSDREKKLVGAGGFASWMPITSLKPMIEGSVARPPAVDLSLKVIQGIASGEAEKLVRTAKDAGGAFLPGAGFLRFLLEDLPTYATGENPNK